MKELEALLVRVTRDAKILVAVQHALGSMELIEGATITIEGIQGRLNLGGEIGALKEVVEMVAGDQRS